MTSCSSEPNQDNSLVHEAKTPKTNVKIYRNNQLVDTLFEIEPITQSDTLQFNSIYNDTLEIIAQKKIFSLNRIKNWTTIENNFFKFWFTTLIDKSDSTKDYGLFYVRKKDNAAIEHCRIRVNNRNEIIGVNSNPILSNNYTPLDTWVADTILLDE